MAKEILKTILIFFILIEFIDGDIVLTVDKVGEINGNYYDFYNADNLGKAKMIISENNFTCSWKNIENVVFRYGKKYKPYKSMEELGKVNINFEVEMNSEGYAYAGINGYGGSNEVFYIIEDYSDKFVPPSTSLGTVSIDNGTYEIYYKETRFPPNIYGIAYQSEYWSVRKEKRNKGMINFTKHFQSWKQKKSKFEDIGGITFIIEGYKSAGDAILNQLEIKYEQN